MIDKNVLNQAFSYMVLLEASNIVESKLLSKAKIKNRQLVRDGLKSLERATTSLFKYNDFSEDETDTMRRTIQHLSKCQDILEDYVKKENRGYEKMLGAISAVKNNINIQLVHKDEQAVTEHFAEQTYTELDDIFLLHRDMFEIAFACVTQLDADRMATFGEELNSLCVKYFGEKDKFKEA